MIDRDLLGLPHNADKPAPVRMYELLYISLISQLLVAVAELGVADEFGDEPQHIDELARRTASDANSLYRALRALATIGVFTEVEPRTFAMTPLSETLRSDANGSMRDLARYVGLPPRQRAFESLAYSLRTGKPAFDHVHGMDWWTHFAAHPELSTLFNNAMGTMNRMVNSATLEAYDLAGARRLVDVGAGKGHLVATLLRQYPDMTGIVFDQPHVVAEAAEVLRSAGVADRAECIGGDFFVSVPGGGDLYILSWTIHDWNDQDATAILRNIREAMGEGGQLIVIDEVLPEGDAAHFGKFEDIVMLALLKGRVRTEAEFATLFEAAGLRLKDVRATQAPTSILVAVSA